MAVNLQAGQMVRNRIRIEQRGAPISDGAGNEVATWETLCERAAAMKALPVTGASPEAVIQGRLTGTAIVTIVVRYDAKTKQITTDDRAVHVSTGDVYNIRSALDLDNDRRWITLDCQKGVAT
jgi:SPP1 family predicted phage head-tail adaptor